ncbi:MAG: hypothetical protein ACRYGA_07885 [Janthinobacterium lividum]
MTFDVGYAYADVIEENYSPTINKKRSGWHTTSRRNLRSSVSTVTDAVNNSWLANSSDPSALPGEAVTKAVLDDIFARQRLCALVKAISLDVEYFGASGGFALQTRASALSLLNALPRGSRLPQISPDGSGGLLLLWDALNPLVVTVEGIKLHFVEKAGSPMAVYHDDIDFSEHKVPDNLLAAIISS